MAYMNQEKKAALIPGIKAVLKKYGVKATFSVRHNMTLVAKIKSAPFELLDKDGDEVDNVNRYYIEENFTGTFKDFLLELKDAMNVGNYDHSDVQSDFWDIGWYIDIRIAN